MNPSSSKRKGRGPWNAPNKTVAVVTIDAAQDQLQAAQSQLLVYAKDLKHLLQQEEKKTHQLKLTHAQLLTYAKDLKHSLDAEQHNT